MVNGAFAKQAPPEYNNDRDEVAQNGNQQDGAPQRVDRRMRKSGAALLLDSRVGQQFHAVVTGLTTEGLGVRLVTPPAEGKVVRGAMGMRLGDKVRVELVSTNVDRGFIDFVTVN